MKKSLFLILILLGLGVILGGCAGRGKSPVGTYSCTDPFDNVLTVITLNANGSATMKKSNWDEEYHTYWDYAGKGIDVRIHTEVGTWYYMDFDEHRIYWGSKDYRSSTNGNIFMKKQ